MKNYKDTNNTVFSYDDDIDTELLQALIAKNGLTPITQTEMSDLLAPTQDQLLADKWGLYAEYCSTLTVTTLVGNKFAADSAGLRNVVFKRDSITDADRILWVEDWGSFTTDKVELQEVVNEASTLMQAKIIELFGA